MMQRWPRLEHSINFLTQPDVLILCDNFAKPFCEEGMASPGNFFNETFYLELEMDNWETSIHSIS